MSNKGARKSERVAWVASSDRFKNNLAVEWRGIAGNEERIKLGMNERSSRGNIWEGEDFFVEIRWTFDSWTRKPEDIGPT